MNQKITIVFLCCFLLTPPVHAISMEQAASNAVKAGILFCFSYAIENGKNNMHGRSQEIVLAKGALSTISWSAAVVGVDNILRIVDTTVPNVVTALVNKSRDFYRLIWLAA